VTFCARGREEWSLFTDILPDRRFEIAALHSGRQSANGIDGNNNHVDEEIQQRFPTPLLLNTGSDQQLSKIVKIAKPASP